MMHQRIRIGGKITLWLLAVIAVAITAVSYLYYSQVKEMTEAGYREKLGLQAAINAKQVVTRFKSLEVCLSDMEVAPEVSWSVARLTEHAQQPLPAVLYDRINHRLDTFFIRLRQNYGFQNIRIFSMAGVPLYSLEGLPSRADGEDAFAAQNALLEGLKDGINPQIMRRSQPFKNGSSVCIYIGRKLMSGGTLKAIAVIDYNLTQHIGPMLFDSEATGQHSEVLLAQKMGTSLLVLPCQQPSELPLSRIEIGAQSGKALQRASEGNASGFMRDAHYINGEKILAYWRYLPELDWGMVVQLPASHIEQMLHTVIYRLVGIGLMVLLLSGAVAYLVLSVLFLPLQRLRASIQLLGKGVLPSGIHTNSTDEVGDMARAVADLVQTFTRTAGFAQEIGKGNYDADFQPMSQQDVLGNALVAMKESIRASDENDRNQQWITEGVAELGLLMRFRSDLKSLGDDTLPFLVQKVGAIQGAFYTISNSEQGELLTMQASYAFGKKRKIHASFMLGDGLVGQCGQAQETLFYTEIPADYAHISSGILGDRKPHSLLFVPLVNNHATHGVLELASAWRFEPHQIRFVEEVSSIIARAIFNIKNNEQTARMLRDAQFLGNELQEKQVALEEQARAMAKTQEQLESTNIALQAKIAEVNQAQKRMALLLENASEAIAIYEGNGALRYISPSSQRILGYLPDELVGLGNTAHIHPDNDRQFHQFFEHLLENPELSEAIQYEYFKKNGETVWVEATGKNLMHDPAIQGVLLNITDITERRLAEKEQRMRNQMQALSENSPDMIARINAKGLFYYANPMISQLTGRKREYFLSRSLYDVNLPEEVLAVWQQLFKQVMRTKVAAAAEMVFPSVDGIRNMQVSAIPEFGEETVVESVLLVCHNITDRKQEAQALEIANKKMTESINYAHRIQSAILPQQEVLRRMLPQSFMFYKPRDIVSGDFPWIFRRGDDIFVAVVDCTGHGVPGALLSVIGHFVLQEAVSSEIKSAGQVLDRLHTGVKRTLNQSEEDNFEDSPRDGMDIALCRMNLAEGVLEYAGAHRPLYYLSKADGLQECKGNRFPVGGAGYRNRTAFTTHTIALAAGDEAYIFSDGYADQFGGMNNRKMGHQRIREILEESGSRSMDMAEKGRLVADAFTGWMGNRKQTDDVLLIGIRF